MDVDSPSLHQNLLPLPRLRLMRNAQQHHLHSEFQPSPAGPSRVAEARPRVDLNSDDDGDDQSKTPRLRPMSVTPPNQLTGLPMEVPVARPSLRAVMTLTNDNTSHDATPRPAPPSSPSVLESDFDNPASKPATPSIARESLKDIFSRALRDPGDTPQKGRPRRNSIDTSEVEASPHVKGLTKSKGKRRSLSDEEIENRSGFTRSHDGLSRSSQAATFDHLREKLNNSAHLNNRAFKTQDNRDDHHHDLSHILRDLNSSQATPPRATSTPQRSLLIPLSSSQSNLLEQDSSMNRAMGDLESDPDYSFNHKPESSFPSQLSSSHTPLPRVSSLLARTRVNSEPPKIDDLKLSSREQPPQSSIHRSPSQVDFTSKRHVSDEHDRIHDREREWNKPKPRPRPDTPELKHQHSHSSLLRSTTPVLTSSRQHESLSRRSSIASLNSQEDTVSSRASSVSSRSEFRDRLEETERERHKEREREWNKPQSRHPRPSSSLGLHSPSHTSRTLSNAGRPLSVQNLEALDGHDPHRPLKKRDSFGSSRASSPHGSMSSHDGLHHEIDHERERNWNSPRPHWHNHSPTHSLSNGHVRAYSPLLPRSPTSPTHSRTKSFIDSTAARLHRSGLPVASTSKLGAPTHSHGDKHDSPRPSSRLGHRSQTPELSPLTRQRSKGNIGHSSSGGGFPFPRNRTPLPPIELDKERAEQLQAGEARIASPSPTPGSRPSSRAAGHSGVSRIPVRSPMKGRQSPTVKLQTSQYEEDLLENEPSHRAGFDADERNEDFLPLPTPPVDGDSGSELTEVEKPMSEEVTPVMRIISPPPLAGEPSISVSPPSPMQIDVSQRAMQDESRLKQALSSSSTSSIIQEPSPPPSPASARLLGASHSSSLLETPPRRSSFNSSKVIFQTPSPPKGLPDLPGPPSESDFDSERDALGAQFTPSGERPNGRLDFSSMKTPKPPGAWMTTPVSQRAESEPLEERKSESEFSAGLATPAASMSRASLLAQTPAPPGAWAATPAPRKSILKVRFDALNHADGGVESSDGAASASEETQGVPGASSGPTGRPASSVKVEDVDETIPTTPQPSAARGNREHRRTPSIRVLDAFGRDATPELKKAQAAAERSIRSEQSSIRIVDAMGREVENNGESIDGDTSILDRDDALARVRSGLAELAADMSDYDRSSESFSSNESRLRELDSMSRSAREMKVQLSECIADQQNKITQLRASMRRHKVQDILRSERRFFPIYSSPWLLSGFIFFLLLLLVTINRLADARARQLYLTTYHDPFNPELYNTARHYISHNHAHLRNTWSTLATQDTISDRGWKASTLDLWSTVTNTVTRWDWRAWGEEEPSFAWPPT
ncbi:hypothetical protein HGRIS_002290 [Hohenbuehelia grisea]|uniref:Uncharacterized protein n=1 Tax=Hohenbuehelia grisea TaxID=104357 RepID=A0ABR3JLE8_9AGAR